MAKYKVVRAVEYNHKLYLPTTFAAGRIPDAATSAGSGREIPVDTSGFIEIANQAAASFTLGQIELLKARRQPGTRKQ
ncbi:MAG: hypothetical protein ACRD2O_16130 [Terriglobia bacterium]